MLRVCATLVLVTGCLLGAVGASGAVPLRLFAQETSNGDYSTLTLKSGSAVVTGASFTTSVTSSAYCSAKATQTNIQYQTLDLTPLMTYFNKSALLNETRGNITVTCSRPSTPQCYWYEWQPVIGFLAAQSSVNSSAIWPSPYSSSCVSYSSGTACALQTYVAQRVVPSGNKTASGPCHRFAWNVTGAEVVSQYGGALLFGLTIPFSVDVCQLQGGFLSVSCSITGTFH